MRYYCILPSLNQKIMGHIPQVKEVVHNCHVWDNPNFVDRFPFQKIENEPILSNAVLFSKSKKTDLIESGGIGFSFGSILLSEKLKKILEIFNNFGVQFFQTKIYHKNIVDPNYWQSHIFDVPYDFIDFEKSVIIMKDSDENRKPIKRKLQLNKKDEFLNLANSLRYPKMVNIDKIQFKPEMNLDCFFLRFYGNPYTLVSEDLKDFIEQNNCTGIEFKPIDISISDWLGANGLRANIYGRNPQMGPDGVTS